MPRQEFEEEEDEIRSQASREAVETEPSGDLDGRGQGDGEGDGGGSDGYGDGTAAAEAAAAALAGGSGSAQAVVQARALATPTRTAEMTPVEATALRKRELDVARTQALPGLHQRFPELPEEEARVVIAELKGSATRREGQYEGGVSWEARHKKPRTAAAASGPRQADAIADDQEGMRAEAGADASHAAKRRRIERTPAEERDGRSATAEHEEGQLSRISDDFDEDPFNFIEEDLAAQPPLVNRQAQRRAAGIAGPGTGDGGPQEEAGERHSPAAKRARHETSVSQTGGGPGGQGAERRQFGRRYTGLSADPVDARESNGHSLHITGPMIWCAICGRYALRRVGKSLKSRCVGQALGAYATRLARLREGKHPMTNVALVD